MRLALRAVASTALLAALLLTLVVGCGSGSPPSGVDCFDTPDWAEAGSLELRAGPSGAALLLRHRTTVQRLREDYPGSQVGADSKPPSVYRFDAATGRLALAADADWRAGSADVADCEGQSAAPATPFVLDARERTLRWRDRAVRAAGRNVLLLAAAPRGDLVAVLSATGSVMDSIMPFLGRGGAGGQHYHQAFRRSDGTEQGDAVPLPMTSREVGLVGCWSADASSVVYADVLYNHLCIVHPQAAGGDRR